MCWRPLTDAQMAVIREVFEPTKIGRLIDAAVVGSGVNTFEAVERANAIDAFDVEVARALRLSAWPQSQHNLVLEFARYVLVKQPHTVRGATKSQLQWLEDYVALVASNPALKRPLPALSRLLHVGEAQAIQEHVYEVTIELKSKGTGKIKIPVDLAVLHGTMTVKKVSPAPWREKTLQTYNVILGALGVKLGGGGGSVEGSGRLTSREEWTPDDFVGSLTLTYGGVGAGKKLGRENVGLGARSVGVVIRGGGQHQALIGAVDVALEKRGGVGIEAYTCHGYVTRPGDPPKQDFSRQPARFDYRATGNPDSHVHFRFGSSILERAGRVAVRSFCATWLPWLESADSSLQIVGHADSVDRPDRNLELSRLRAKNVQQAIKDVLGHKLKVPDDKVHVAAWGECEAYWQGEEDTEFRMRRRVDILCNGVCVLTLWSG